MSSAIVTGATGILGGAIVNQLGRDSKKWKKVYAFSRSRKGSSLDNVEQRQLDLCGNLDEMTETLRGVTAEYVFFSAYLEQDTEQKAWDVNGHMLKTFLDALTASGAAKHIKRVLLVAGAKQYGVHLGPVKNPMEESDEWLSDINVFPPNFYYNQQQILFDFCKKSNGQTTWNVTFPNDVIGFAPRAFMNLSTALAIYAAVSRELGQGLSFPGSETFYFGYDSYTDADLHARFAEWVVLNPKAGNEAFNVVNGDVQSWQTMWPLVAKHFGIEVNPKQFVGQHALASSNQLNPTPPLSVYAKKAGLPDSIRRGQLDQRIDLIQWSKQAEVREAWARLAKKHQLDESALDKATWKFLAFVWARNFDLVISMNKAREFGWTEHLNTWTSFENIFQRLEQEKVIPPSK